MRWLWCRHGEAPCAAPRTLVAGSMGRGCQPCRGVHPRSEHRRLCFLLPPHDAVSLTSPPLVRGPPHGPLLPRLLLQPCPLCLPFLLCHHLCLCCPPLRCRRLLLSPPRLYDLLSRKHTLISCPAISLLRVPLCLSIPLLRVPPRLLPTLVVCLALRHLDSGQRPLVFSSPLCVVIEYCVCVIRACGRRPAGAWGRRVRRLPLLMAFDKYRLQLTQTLEDVLPILFS